MHLPTYIVLMAIATLYDLTQLFVSWYVNKLLFTAGVMILVVTAIVGLFQLLDAESLQFKWILWYSIPVAFLLVGEVVRLVEINNQILQSIGESPLPSILPGKSDDYRGAATGHYISMLIPALALAIAHVVGVFQRRY